MSSKKVAESDKPDGSIRRLVVIVAAIILVVAAGVTAVYILSSSTDEKQEPQQTETHAEDDSTVHEDLNESHLKALALVGSGDIKAAYELAAKDVSEAEKLGDKSKIYDAKSNQAIVFLTAGDRQQALVVFVNILDTDIERSTKLNVLNEIISIYGDLGDTTNEKKYLEQYVKLCEDMDVSPTVYIDRLEELENA